MCQLCGIRDMAARGRWPKPLEGNVQEILGLLPTAHKEVTNYTTQQDLVRKTKTQEKPNESFSADLKADLTSAYESILQTLDMLETLFKLLSEARIEWWNSPEKRQQRRQWDEAGDVEKLTQLQKINQKCIDMIADMVALVGRFRRWSLDSAKDDSDRATNSGHG